MAKPAKIVILGDASDAARAFKTIRDEAGRTSSKLDSVASQMGSAGSTLTRGVTLPILGAGLATIKLAATQEKAEAKLSSAFDSMGASAWTSVDALEAQAAAFQASTTHGDEAILAAQSVLLTFGNVQDQVGAGNDVFTQATGSILDMSDALEMDLQSATTMVGKALNDPIAGISAMSRAGIQFTDQQKDQIKTMVESGDTLGAQKIILSELENQFGGTAEAMAATSEGKLKQAMNSLGDAGEQIGTALAPVLSLVADLISKLAERFSSMSPTMQNWVIGIAAAAAAVGPVLIVGAKLVKTFGAVGKAFGVLSKLMAANPWLILIAAVVALVVLIVTNWDTIVETVRKALAWISEKAAAAGEWLKTKFAEAMEFLKTLFLNWTGPGLIIKHWDTIKETAAAVGEWLKTKFAEAMEFLKTLFLNWTGAGLIIKHWDDIKAAATIAKEWVTTAFQEMIDWFVEAPGKLASATAGLFDGIKTAFRSALNWVIDKWNGLSFTLPSFSAFGQTIGGATISTPNIPRFHSGGTFRAARPGGEGLAMLLDGERVTRPGVSAGGDVTIAFYGPVYGTRDFERAVTDAVIRARRRGVVA